LAKIIKPSEFGENEMTFTKYNTKVNHLTTHEMVASQMKKGELNELRLICDIGNVLRDMGKSNTQINYLMNVDEDFITDVLSCYKWEAERFASRTI
jgi:hypothetical protein